MAAPSVITKICGIRAKDALDTAIQHGAQFIGFVHFPKSPRHIEPQDAAILDKGLGAIKSVAVIVDKTLDEIKDYLTAFTPNLLQLHGSETVEFVKALRAALPNMGLIKAISVRSGDDIAKAHAFSPFVDYLLFDAKAPAGGLPGGNGMSFDWALLKNREFDKPWFLSGGINTDNVEEAVRLSGARMVDVSSSMESEPGVKDPGRIEAFLARVNTIRL